MGSLPVDLLPFIVYIYMIRKDHLYSFYHSGS